MLRALLLAAAMVGLTTAAAAQAPKRGGILNFAVVAETSGYDCHASQTFALLHSVTPQYLCWSGGTPRSLTYTFKLHAGIKFHDGSPLTLGGIMRPGSQWALPETELEKVIGYAKDIDKAREQARRLLKEAGADGLRFKLLNRTMPEPYTPSGIFVIDEWRKIGITTEHLQVETKTYFDRLVSGNFGVALWPATEPADDPTSMLYYFISHTTSSAMTLRR